MFSEEGLKTVEIERCRKDVTELRNMLYETKKFSTESIGRQRQVFSTVCWSVFGTIFLESEEKNTRFRSQNPFRRFSLSLRMSSFVVTVRNIFCTCAAVTSCATKADMIGLISQRVCLFYSSLSDDKKIVYAHMPTYPKV